MVTPEKILTVRGGDCRSGASSRPSLYGVYSKVKETDYPL